MSSQVNVDGAILILKKSIVRPWIKDDAESLAKTANNPNVARYLRNTFPSPYTLADAEFWLNLSQNDTSQYSYPIIDPTTGFVMGGIGMRPEKDVHCRSAELGYWLGEEYWGKGVMSELVPAFVDWCFDNIKVKDNVGDDVDLVRITAMMMDRNKASEHVAKKSGFAYEGVLRASVWKGGIVMDQTLYSIIREDWEKMKRQG
jgi:ribosomal-protein-alanine N-acetyltransferase